LERITAALRSLAIVDLISVISSLFVVWTAITYLRGGEARRQARITAAWTVINTAQAGGSGGRDIALQTLVREGVSLAGIDLRGAVLTGVVLRGADFSQAKLDGAALELADLSCQDTLALNDCTSFAEATLRGSLLDGANLDGADFRSADLRCPDTTQNAAGHGCTSLRAASLRAATLNQAQLKGANLEDADLACLDQATGETVCTSLDLATLVGANLKSAQLVGAFFQGADLSNADLQYADLRLADLRWATFPDDRLMWDPILIRDANVAGARPADFVSWALSLGAVQIEDDDAWKAHRDSACSRLRAEVKQDTSTIRRHPRPSCEKS
jgi:uncharacterized protein YjbI with pentapeptide repeats